MVTKLLFKGAKLAGIFVNGICFTIPGWAEYDQFIDNTMYREARKYPITDTTTYTGAMTYPVLYLDRYSEFVERSRDMMDQLSKRNAHAFDWVKNLNREFAEIGRAHV